MGWLSSMGLVGSSVSSVFGENGVSTKSDVPVAGRKEELRDKFNKHIEEKNTARRAQEQAQAQTLQRYESLDWRMARLPKLSAERLSDPDKGLWELFGQDPVALQAMHMAARDPLKDVQPGVVAIDFGTSSTVVALAQQGRPVVLRVGAHDFKAEPNERDYENPTVLELVNLDKVLKSWQQYAYRPRVQWDHVRCSHEAQQSLRNNQADLKRVASILTRLKHWALRDAKAQPWRVDDQEKQAPWLLMPLKANNPSSHSALQVDADYALDPVELYAYFLGLAINWRERGIFERYVMTFPVAYPQAVKEGLLASFRRGLQRSWPHTLVVQSGALARFSVSEVATEPLAYAAAALPALGLWPEGPGLAYAVFDFGGGTTDFDFGLWREPTPQEQGDGWAEVIHSFGASGDRLLGGENLLELLAYEALVQNAHICREKALVMYPPLGVLPAPGLEAVMDQGLSARTNMQLLMGRLRDFWEQNGHCSAVSTGAVTLSLLNRQGEPVNVTLALDGGALAQSLVQRIGRGVEQFMLALHAAFSARPEALSTVHVLLAGNSCRTAWLARCFDALASVTEGASTKAHGKVDAQATNAPHASLGLTSEYALLLDAMCVHLRQVRDKLFGTGQASAVPLQFVVHAPLTGHPKALHEPSAKTGVALGLLRLCDGEPVLVINDSVQQGEAPFGHFVGLPRFGRFAPVLRAGAAYGQWVALGVPVANAQGHCSLNVLHSASQLAGTGELPQHDESVFKWHWPVPGDVRGQKVWVCPTGPDALYWCVAHEAPAPGEVPDAAVLLNVTAGRDV